MARSWRVIPLHTGSVLRALSMVGFTILGVVPVGYAQVVNERVPVSADAQPEDNPTSDGWMISGSDRVRSTRQLEESDVPPVRRRAGAGGIGFGERRVMRLDGDEITHIFVSADGSAAAGTVAQGSLVPAVNTVTVTFTDPEPNYCRRFAGASLAIKTMSPIVLIHGNSQDGSWWDRHFFTWFLDGMHLVHDNSISLGENLDGKAGVSDDAAELDLKLERVRAQFGVDSVHLIAHSKGGLDAREYLAVLYKLQNALEVLSLTTLSTPHEGSFGADMLEAQRLRLKGASIVLVSDIPATTVLLSSMGAWLDQENLAHSDLTTYQALLFNAGNIPSLPRGIMYNRVGADADRNLSGAIDQCAEVSEMTMDDDVLAIIGLAGCGAVQKAVDFAYQTLGAWRDVTLARLGIFTIVQPSGAVSFRQNDSAVTIRSALGTEGVPSYAALAESPQSAGHDWVFTAGTGRNHSTIGDATVASSTISSLRERDETHGDLR